VTGGAIVDPLASTWSVAAWQLKLGFGVFYSLLISASNETSEAVIVSGAQRAVSESSRPRSLFQQ